MVNGARINPETIIELKSHKLRRQTVQFRKEGSSFDLPLAMAILTASGAVTADTIGDYKTGTVRGDVTIDLRSDMLAGKDKKKLENSQQLTIFEPILEGLQKVNPIENKGEYFDRVMCIIDIFAVAEPIKHNLREGLTVANASARLWNTEYVMVKE